MKFAFTIAATAAATAIAVVHAEPCDLNKLQPLLANPAVATCAKESGYSLVPPTRPTDAQLVGICKSLACKQVLTAVSALGLPDCEIGAISVKKDVIERVATGCSAAGATTTTAPSATSQAPSATTTMAPGATTNAPTGTTNSTTPSPSATTVKPSSSANGTATVTTMPTTMAPSVGSKDASGGDDDVEETVTAEPPSEMSGSGDYEIEETTADASAEETSATAKPVPSPTTKSPSSGAVQAVIATGVASVAALVAAMLV